MNVVASIPPVAPIPIPHLMVTFTSLVKPLSTVSEWNVDRNNKMQ